MRRHLVASHLPIGPKIDMGNGKMTLQHSCFSLIKELFTGSKKTKMIKQFIKTKIISGLEMGGT
jgi:hypothetical protein